MYLLSHKVPRKRPNAKDVPANDTNEACSDTRIISPSPEIELRSFSIRGKRANPLSYHFSTSYVWYENMPHYEDTVVNYMYIYFNGNRCKVRSPGGDIAIQKLISFQRNTFRSHAILSRSLKIIFRYLKIIFRLHALLFRPFNLISRSFKIVFRSHTLLFCFIKISFRSIIIKFRSHALRFRSLSIIFRFLKIIFRFHALPLRYLKSYSVPQHYYFIPSIKSFPFHNMIIHSKALLFLSHAIKFRFLVKIFRSLKLTFRSNGIAFRFLAKISVNHNVF